MTEKKTTKTNEPSFDEEVEQLLNMGSEERNRQSQRRLAEQIVYYRRKARGVQDERRKPA